MFMPVALEGFGYNKIETGIIYAAAPFMRFLLPFIFKHYLKLTHNIYILALIFTVVSSILFTFSINNFTAYLLANLLFGASMGITLPFVETISLQQLSKSLYGKIRMWGSVGFIVIALSLKAFSPLPMTTIYILIITTILTLLFGYFVLQYETEEKRNKNEDEKSFSLKKYWAFWTSIFLMQVAFGGFYTFFSLYETAHGFKDYFPYLWTFAVICEIIMLYFQGPLLKQNLLTILKIATLITVIRWLLLYLYPNSLEVTFFSQAFHAISFALYHTTAITYVFSLYSQKRLAQQFFLGISFGLGGSVGSFLGGYVYGDTGEYLFLFEAFITFGAFMMLLVHDKRKEVIT
jgi:PPP family 3-phenylpropionic acid transporter